MSRFHAGPAPWSLPGSISRRLLLALPALYVLAGCGTRANASSSTVESQRATTTPAAAAGRKSAPPSLENAIRGAVTVFAAASLTEAFQEMATTIGKSEPGVHIVYNFAGSPTLRTQLAQGARADAFASADEPNMRGAQADGSIAGQPRVFAQNKLVVIMPAANPAGIQRLQDLARPGVKLVLAQPAVPVGDYARQSFAKMAQHAAFGATFAAQVAANVVSDEANVKDVVAKVQLGEADAGVVYRTDVTAAVRPKVTLLAIPDQFNVIASYPIATVKDAPNLAGGQAFITYVLSAEGQQILAKYGFEPAPHG